MDVLIPENVQVPSREVLLEQTAAMWGTDCFLCKKPFEEDQKITLDHWYPQSWCYANGWTYDEVWSIENLRLAHKKCNARKGDLIPVDDYTVPTKEVKPPTSRKYKRAARPETCDLCESGRLLLLGEVCDLCGSGPQPAVAPRATQKRPKDCSHSGYDHCWACYLGIIPRKSALQVIIEGE